MARGVQTETIGGYEMKNTLENALARKLTSKEKLYIKWLLSHDKETVETFSGLFNSLYKAGQEDANTANEAISTGERLD